MRCCGGSTSTYSSSCRAQEIPAGAEMAVETAGLVLREHENPPQSAVDAVRKCKVDDAVKPAEGHCRLGAIAGERIESRPAPPARINVSTSRMGRYGRRTPMNGKFRYSSL